jgi:antitoxin ParD1/3/4
MTTNVSLTPELERFARECVESGGYNNVSEVMRSALRLLQERDRRRDAFEAMLKDVQAEADRVGTYSLEEVMAEMDQIIADAECRRPG